MTDPNARIDYFRSEFKGEIAKLQKQMADEALKYGKRLDEMEKKIEALVREVRNCELALR